MLQKYLKEIKWVPPEYFPCFNVSHPENKIIKTRTFLLALNIIKRIYVKFSGDVMRKIVGRITTPGSRRGNSYKTKGGLLCTLHIVNMNRDITVLRFYSNIYTYIGSMKPAI